MSLGRSAYGIGTTGLGLELVLVLVWHVAGCVQLFGYTCARQ